MQEIRHEVVSGRGAAVGGEKHGFLRKEEADIEESDHSDQ